MTERSDSRIHIDGLRPADVALLKSVADQAAEQAVKKTFVAMGLDPEEPSEAQADMVWLRATRKRCEDVQGKVIVAVIGILTTAFFGAMWIGVKIAVKS